MTNNSILFGVYRHYKGKEYDVFAMAKHSETLEEMVVYRARYDDREMWVRPLSMFLEKITINGEEVPRFAFVRAMSDASST